VAFRAIEEGGRHLVTVWVDADEREPAPDAIRVIDVPFEVPSDGTVEIGSISDGVPLQLPPGTYQLRYECFERANSPSPRLHFLFYRDNNPHFNLVRADSDLHPGKELLLTASPA
jgi:hypothetical protein